MVSISGTSFLIWFGHCGTFINIRHMHVVNGNFKNVPVLIASCARIESILVLKQGPYLHIAFDGDIHPNQ